MFTFSFGRFAITRSCSCGFEEEEYDCLGRVYPICDGILEDFLNCLFLYGCALEVWHRYFPHFLTPSANVELKDWLKGATNNMALFTQKKS
jgi:hypothetical protein